MSWLQKLFQAEQLQKIAQWGNIQIVFGPGNTNNLKRLIEDVLAWQSVDRNKQHWFNTLQTNSAPIMGYNGQTLIPAQTISDALFNLSSLIPPMDASKAELNRLSEELKQRVTQRQQQTEQQQEQKHLKNRKVTSFRFMQATADYYTYALSWTSHIPGKERAYLWEGKDFRGKPAPHLMNPIKDQIEQQLGIKLYRDKKGLPSEWLVTGMTPDRIPQLKDIFVNEGYDASVIDAAMQAPTEQTNRAGKFPLQFDNVSAQVDYHLSVNLGQFAGREKDVLPTFLDIVYKIFTVKGPKPAPVAAKTPEAPVPVTAKVTDRVRENLAKKREQFIQPAGEYYAKEQSALFFRGSFGIYQDFQKMLAMKGFDTADLIAKALHKGSELRNSKHVVMHRLVNGVVDGYWKARANRQRLKDSLGLYLPNEEAFQEEVQGYVIQKAGEDPYRLYPLQGKGVQWLYSRQSALLGDETGVGKTEQLIVAADLRTKEKNSLGETNLWDPKLATGKVLIFTVASVVTQFATRILQVLGMPEESLGQPGCPVKLSMAEMNQPEAKWLILSYGSINTLTKEEQEKKMGDTEEAAEAEDMVMSDEELMTPQELASYKKRERAKIAKERRIKKVTDLMQQLRLQNFDVMILDECHNIKNDTANTSQNIVEIGNAIPFKWGASATISANTPVDLHHQLRGIGNPMGFMKKDPFSRKYTGMKAKKIRGREQEYYADPSNAKGFLDIVKSEYGGFDALDLPGKIDITIQLADEMLRPVVDSQIQNITDLHAMLILTDVYTRKTKNQVRDNMPEHFRKPHFLPTDEQSRLNLAEAVENRLEQKRAIGQDADSPLTRLVAYRTEMALQKVPYSIRMAMNIINRGEKVLLFTCYKEPAKALESGLQEALQPLGFEVYMTMGEGTGTARKANMVQAFRDPNSNMRAFVLSILSSGTGLDLPNITSNVIINDIAWTPKDADQVEGRAFRVNSENSVNTHYMVLQDTPDAVIYSTVQKKRDIAQRIQDIDERYAQKVRRNESTDQELKEAQKEHWALVQEQLTTEITVQHFWMEQQKLRGPRSVVSSTWLRKLIGPPTWIDTIVARADSTTQF